MHISEGVLSGPVLISGMALTAAGTAVGLRKLDYDRIAQAGIASAAAFACGSFSVLLGGIIVGAALVFTEESFLEVALLVVAANIPVMIIEGFITAFSVSFIKRVQPDMLPGCTAHRLSA